LAIGTCPVDDTEEKLCSIKMGKTKSERGRYLPRSLQMKIELLPGQKNKLATSGGNRKRESTFKNLT